MARPSKKIKLKNVVNTTEAEASIDDATMRKEKAEHELAVFLAGQGDKPCTRAMRDTLAELEGARKKWSDVVSSLTKDIERDPGAPMQEPAPVSAPKSPPTQHANTHDQNTAQETAVPKGLFHGSEYIAPPNTDNPSQFPLPGVYRFPENDDINMMVPYNYSQYPQAHHHTGAHHNGSSFFNFDVPGSFPNNGMDVNFGSQDRYMGQRVASSWPPNAPFPDTAGAFHTNPYDTSQRPYSINSAQNWPTSSSMWNFNINGDQSFGGKMEYDDGGTSNPQQSNTAPPTHPQMNANYGSMPHYHRPAAHQHHERLQEPSHSGTPVTPVDPLSASPDPPIPMIGLATSTDPTPNTSMSRSQTPHSPVSPMADIRSPVSPMALGSPIAPKATIGSPVSPKATIGSPVAPKATIGSPAAPKATIGSPAAPKATIGSSVAPMATATSNVSNSPSHAASSPKSALLTMTGDAVVPSRHSSPDSVSNPTEMVESKHAVLSPLVELKQRLKHLEVRATKRYNRLKGDPDNVLYQNAAAEIKEQLRLTRESITKAKGKAPKKAVDKQQDKSSKRARRHSNASNGMNGSDDNDTYPADEIMSAGQHKYPPSLKLHYVGPNWSEEQQEEFIARGVIAIEEFCEDQDTEIDPDIRRTIRQVDHFLPQAAQISYDLALHVHANAFGNLQCRYHEKTKYYERWDGKIGDPFVVNGASYHYNLNPQASDKFQPRPGFMHCGCPIDEVLMDFYFFKTWTARSRRPSYRDRMEGWGPDCPTPRHRTFVVQAFQCVTGLSINNIYSTQWDEPEHKIQLLNTQLDHILQSFKRLGTVPRAFLTLGQAAADKEKEMDTSSRLLDRP